MKFALAVVLSIVLLMVLLPSALAQGPGQLTGDPMEYKWIPSAWWSVEYENYLISQGWKLWGYRVLSTGYGMQEGWYIYARPIYRPGAVPLIVPAYPLYESQCQSWGTCWHYDWNLHRCVCTF